MFEPVCESFVKLANLRKYYKATGSKQLAYQKIQKAARKRPIVKAKKTENPKSSTDHNPSKDNIGEDLFFENYDKDGNIILRSSERKKHIGEIV